MDETTEKLLAMFAVIGLGLAFGKLSWRGISLGTSGVVFIALVAGHFGFQVPRTAGTVGIIVFAYCLGLGAGPGFLRMFIRRGKALGLTAVSMIVSAGAVAWLLASTLNLNADLVSGLFAGALTSTPALAVAAERLPPDSNVAVGFGIAYPFGVIGVILFAQLVPRFLATVGGVAQDEDDTDPVDDGPISRVLVHVINPAMQGKRLRDVAVLSATNCQVSRLMVGERLEPIPSQFQLQVGQHVLVVGRTRRLPDVVDVLGEKCNDVNFTLDLERQRRRVVVTSKELLGKSLKTLHLRSKFGVTISRISRQEVEFVPSPDEHIHFGDALTAIGEPEGLDKFVQFAGHRERTLDETDLISLAAGLVLGVIAGSIQLSIGSRSISLGMAGGPLMVGLALGHFGRIGPVVSRMPRAARLLLAESGLALFLAQAGSQAGGQFLEVIRQHGLLLCIASIAIVTAPLVVGFVVARLSLRLGMLESLGGICGAMTSTPGLGAVTSTTDSSLPATSYATVYPLALILITILVPLLISQMS